MFQSYHNTNLHFEKNADLPFDSSSIEKYVQMRFGIRYDQLIFKDDLIKCVRGQSYPILVVPAATGTYNCYDSKLMVTI